MKTAHFQFSIRYFLVILLLSGICSLTLAGQVAAKVADPEQPGRFITAAPDEETFQRPEDIPFYATVSAGLYHSAMINYDGKVYLWGDNSFGQLGLSSAESYVDQPTLLELPRPATAISLGAYHTLILLDDGTVHASGRNSFGQLGNQTLEVSDRPVMVEALTDIVAVSAGAFHSLALSADGSIWGWGNNTDRQIGDVADQEIIDPDGQVVGFRCLKPVKIIDTGAAAIAAGGHHSLYLDQEGYVYAWGANDRGQLGNGTTQLQGKPTRISGLTDIVRIAAGYQHNLVLGRSAQFAADQLWSWGDNSLGQCGTGRIHTAAPFHTSPLLTDWTSPLVTSLPEQDPGNIDMIAAGFAHSAALVRPPAPAADTEPQARHQLLLWGSNSHGQQARSYAGDAVLRPALLVKTLDGHLSDSFLTFDSLALGGHHSLLLSSKGLLAAAGRGDQGQLGTISVINRPVFSPVPIPDVIRPAFRTGSKIALSWLDEQQLSLRWPAAQDNRDLTVAYRVYIRQPEQLHEKFETGTEQQLVISGLNPDQPLEILVTAYDQAAGSASWPELSRLTSYYLPADRSDADITDYFPRPQPTIYQLNRPAHNWQPDSTVRLQPQEVPWSLNAFYGQKVIEPPASWRSFWLTAGLAGLLLLAFLFDLLRITLRQGSRVQVTGQQDAGTD